VLRTRKELYGLRDIIDVQELERGREMIQVEESKGRKIIGEER
jgi:hypothetical protein